jgi:hypothetical protein
MVLDAYIRLLGRIIDRIITPNIAPTLKHQFASLGKNSLADIPNAIRINIVNHPSHFTLALDLKKALDTISRQHITNVLESMKN